MSTELRHVKGLSDFNNILKKLPKEFQDKIMRTAIRDGGKVFAEELERVAPVASGETKGTVRVRVRSIKGRVACSVTVGGKLFPQAYWYEFGTQPHLIMAKEEARPQRVTRRGEVKGVSIRTMNRMLYRGSLKIRGKLVGASVMHPGQRPRPWVRPALDRKAGDAIIAIANRIRKELGRKKYGGNKALRGQLKRIEVFA